VSLLRAAQGGPVETLTTPDNAEGGYGHVWPQWLPNGRHVLFTIWRADEQGTTRGAAVLSLDTGTWRFVLEENASGARYVESGHLLYTYAPGSALQGVPFDLEKLEAHGVPVPILDVYYRTLRGHSPFAVSKSGTLAFNPEDPARRTLVWVDREGRAEPLKREESQYEFPRISPDGSRIAFEELRDLWVMDLERGTRSRLTSKATNTRPVWTRDGESIVFSSTRSEGWNLYSTSVQGTGEPVLVAASEYPQFVHSVSPSPRATLAVVQNNPVTGLDIWVLPPGEEPRRFQTSPFKETEPQFAPDGRFLAYVSDESGREEVYVQSYPSTGDRWQISTEGATEPLWSRDGKELFFRHGRTLLAVNVTTDPTFELVGIPQALFDGNYHSSTTYHGGAEYDVSRDGTRFLMIRREPDSIPARIHVVLNWFEELERLVPTDE